MRRTLAAACIALGLLAALPHPVHAQATSSDAIFDDTTLHRIDLWVNSRDWFFLKANYQTNEYYPANLRWKGQTVQNVGIRSRGLGSRSQIKPGLRVDFNRYTTGQQFLGLKALVLDNLTQDPSLLHEVVTMKVFRRMGMQAPRESLATLYVNNEYMGVYAIIEEPDDVAMARMYGDGSGYLYEYNWVVEWHFEDLGTDIAPYQPLFSPRTHETESAAALYQPIVSMVQTFNYASDETFETKASAYVDLQQFLRHVAIQAYVSEIDGLLGSWGLSNFYLYRVTNSQPYRIVPWDEDNAFFWSRYPVDQNQQPNVLMRRLMERPSWRQFYYDTMLGVAASVEEGGEPIPDWPGELGGGWLEREITRLQGLVHDAALADPLKPWSNGDVQAAWDAMVAFARERGTFVRSDIARVTR
jgi:spore coat protein H